MEGEEEQLPQEAHAEPPVTSGASEVVPRVLSGEPQNLCLCSLSLLSTGQEGWAAPWLAGLRPGGPPSLRRGALACPGVLRGALERTWADVDAFNLLLEMKLKRRRERPHLPRTVTELVAEDGSRVYVVGTAHFSDDSKKDVVKNGVMSGLMQMLLLKVSAHITEQLGMAPGGEFREAFKEASKVPFCKFHLGDRPIPVTFKRAIAALSFWQKVKLAWGLCFLSDPISKDDVERCKQKDLLEQMMAEMVGEFPDLHRTIVSERDIYLTYMLRQAARRLELPRSSNAEPRKCVPSVVVGVVGMGHVPGIEKNWTTDLNIQEIMTVPPPSIFGRASRLAVKVAFLGLLGYGLYWMGRRTAGLVLSLPATQYCLQRASSARPHK
ncbi:traB domain-containing protein isoform X4 [Rousettus aegyptiacus]|uniref:traB domain-containing protein isoform X4 n=1 Tax=Rousettus aegyptiacus TaxID=9407 RepID=UPI00168D2F83|nr:traB domain-containing protein isoform X4 [Rousettus aegyptiacus]